MLMIARLFRRRSGLPLVVAVCMDLARTPGGIGKLRSIRAEVPRESLADFDSMLLVVAREFAAGFETGRAVAIAMLRMLPQSRVSL